MMLYIIYNIEVFKQSIFYIKNILYHYNVYQLTNFNLYTNTHTHNIKLRSFQSYCINNKLNIYLKLSKLYR